MKLRRLNARRLCRPSDAFLPAALMVAALVTGERRVALGLFAAAFGVSLLSLFAAFGLRAAFARQPAMRDVRGSVKTALLLQCGGLVAACLACLAWFRFDFDALTVFLPVIGAGFLLNIEHTFYEYLYATGDGRSASLSRGLTALLVGAGAVLAGGEYASPWLPATAGLSALAAFVVGAVMGDGLKGRLNAAVIRCAPRAAIQAAAYPAAALLLYGFVLKKTGAAPFFAGLIVYALCLTPFRRSRMEAPPMNRALAIVGGVAAAALLAALFVPGLPLGLAAAKKEIIAYGAMILAACACAFAVVGNG